ncbi:MAG TPA: GNAT family N-acetyltransferase [Chloroflexota bacterium]
MHVLERYDFERINATLPGMRREALPGLVRLIDLVGTFSTVIYTDLSEADVELAIDEQTRYFQKLGHEFEWKVFAHDRPAGMVDRLRARGFDIDQTEAIVALDIEAAPALTLRPTPHVRRVVDPLEAPERIRWEMEHVPEEVSVYVAEVDGRTVSHGWVRFPEQSAFASMWGGATEPELRGRGLYSELISRRVQEARERGYRYVTVDAGPMSRPILERRGFQVLTLATACTRAPST